MKNDIESRTTLLLEKIK